MVSVDLVYKTVLYILNKEQRGYLTPAEFNSIGTQVQLEIFEQYFEDLNVQLRIPENDSEYANRQKTIKEKISFFETNENITGGSPFDLSTLTTKLHRLVRKPANPVWAYKVGTLGQYIFDDTPGGGAGIIPSTGFKNFEISNLDQTELILKILAYTGVVLRDANIVTTATQMAMNEDALEKQ